MTSMEKLRIRQAKNSDFKEIFPLLKQLWEKKRLDKKLLRKIFINNLKGEIVYFIAEMENKIVGICSMQIRRNFLHNKVGLIDELVISKEIRHHGVGSELLVHVTKFAKNKKCKYVELYSGFKRKNAHKFYLHKHFDKTAYYFSKKL